MGRTSLIIIGVVLLLCGMLALGLKVQAQKAQIEEPAEVATRYGTSYRTGPEWDKLREYERLGSEGYEGFEKLMSSSQPDVAGEAAVILTRNNDEGIDHFLRGMSTISSQAKYYVGGNTYYDAVWQRAIEIIQNQEEEFLDGTTFFLRLENSDMGRTRLSEGEVFDALVDTIPVASGKYADELALTIGFFLPGDVGALTDHLKSSVKQDRLIAVRALGKLRLEETLPDLRKLKTDSEKSVRLAAITAEGSIEAEIVAAKARLSRSSSIVRSDSNLERENAKKGSGCPKDLRGIYRYTIQRDRP